MTPRTSCPACDGALGLWRAARDFVRQQTFRLLRCAECGLVTVDPVPDERELAVYYTDAFYGRPSLVSRMALRLFYGRRAAVARRHHAQLKRLLDVGCGDGGFLAHMASGGVEVEGFEPSAAGAARARHQVGLVYDDLDAVTGTFDVITAWQVLEHVVEPRPFLRRLRNLLAPGGVVVLSVPHIESLEGQLGGDAWFHLDVPRHLHHFSRASLRQLVSTNGFDVIDVDTFSLEYGPFGLLQTALNLLPIERNALYQWTKHERALSSFSVSTALALVLGGAAAGPAALLASIAQAAVGRGGVVTVTARAR